MVQKDEVMAQLDRILTSSVFANSERSKEFLKYCVNHGLHGEVSHLKETTIAVEVFLREASYDPKSDPIVRVHARRVREKLEIYYRTTGRRDPIAIGLPKGGYVPQFLRLNEEHPEQQPEVRLSEEHLVAVSPSVSFDSTMTRKHRLSIYAFVLVVLLAVLGGMLAIWHWKERTSETIALRSLQPISDLPSDAQDVSWSRNGKEVAFVQLDAAHRPYLSILNLSAPQSPQRLPSKALADYRPVWSPDNRQLAFIRMLDDVHFVIVRRNIATGAEETSRSFVTYFPLSVSHPTLDWAPDGQSLLTAEQISPDVPMRLVVMNVQDGKRRYLTSPPIGSSGDIEAKFSPDGRYVAFRRGGLGDLYRIDIAGERSAHATRMTFDNRGVRGITFADGGRSILFGTDHSANEMFTIYKIPAAGGVAIPVTPKGFAAVDPASLEDGAFSFRHVELETQMVEITKNEATGSPVLSGASIDEYATFSPDSNTIAFISTRSGSAELWLKHRGSEAPERTTHFDGQGFLFEPHWSPDGDRITFSFRKDGATNVMVYNVLTHELKRVTDTTNRDFNPIFSRDGRSIFFSSNADGTSRIWRIDVEGKQPPEPLFTEAVANFASSFDGQWLYYLDNRQQLTIFRISLLDGTTQEIYRTDARPALVNSLVVTPEGIYLAVSHLNEQEIRIDRIDPVSFLAKTVWRIPGYVDASILGSQSFDVTSDGSQLLTTRVLRHSSNHFLSAATR